MTDQQKAIIKGGYVYFKDTRNARNGLRQTATEDDIRRYGRDAFVWDYDAFNAHQRLS